MSVDVAAFAGVIAEQKTAFARFGRLLADIMTAAKAKDGVRVAVLTPQLVETQNLAIELDAKMKALAEAGARQLGIPVEQFKLSLLDKDKTYVALVDDARLQASNTARLAAQAAGVLTANITVIEDTIKILENIDARAVGYGPDRLTPRSASSKLIDRSA